MNEKCSAVLLNKLPSKEKDPRSFTIPCDIGKLHINNALADLGASISLMPYTMHEKLGLEGSIDQSDLEGCKPVECKTDNDSDSDEPIRCIASINTMYPVVQETAKPVEVEREHLYSASANEIDEKKLELKDFPHHLEYAYLHDDKSFPIIILSELFEKEKISLLQVLEKRKRVIAWKMSDIKGISPSYCTHKILMEDDFKPVIQPQRRLNLKVQDVVKNDIVKLLNSGLIYPISDSSWDVKPRLIRWVLLLQRFNIEIKDKKGAKNLAADHLSRLENPDLGTFTEEEIADEFPDKHLMVLKIELNNDEPWYADYVNYLFGKIMPPNWTAKKRRRFFSQVKNYFWDEPYAFKLCTDNIMRRCVAGNEIFKVLAHCHFGPTRGHHSASVTERKVYKSGFFWPSIFKDAKDYVMRCDACQRLGNISSRSEMPQNNIQIEHNAYWALKQCNMDLTAAARNRFMELNKLIELKDGAYENTWIYKERTKRWHDSRLRGDKNFKVGDMVLLFNSRFKMHLGKLQSRWYGPNVVKTVYPYGTMEITDKNRISFKVNGQRLKKYHERHLDIEDKEVVEFEEDTT
ncbi:reverse transcriptase domain-containing protein [Tanacetum coccineum]